MKISEYINYLITAYEDQNEEVSLDKICKAVQDEFGVKCTHEYIGGFDSTGYSIYCYAIAFIDEDGEVDIVSYTHEVY